MLENRYENYSDWDLRTLEVVPFLKAVPLSMLLSLPIGIFLTKNIVLWLIIGALVGVVVACEEIFEKRSKQGQININNNVNENPEKNSQPANSHSREGGAST